MKSLLHIAAVPAMALLLIVAGVGGAEDKTAGSKGGIEDQLAKSDKPVEINADNMVVYRKESKVIFTGRVVLKQAPTVINSKKLTAFYTEKDWEVRKAICEGNVRITHNNTFAKCGRATYDNENRVITMEQLPVIYQDNHVFRGTILKYYLDDERITGKDVKYQRNPEPAPAAPPGPQ